MNIENFKKKEHSARWALFYIDKIGERLAYKLQGLNKPYDEFRILVQDETHKYDSDGITLATKTLERKGFNMTMVKYRIMSNGNFAYIFKLSRKKV